MKFADVKVGDEFLIRAGANIGFTQVDKVVKVSVESVSPKQFKLTNGYKVRKEDGSYIGSYGKLKDLSGCPEEVDCIMKNYNTKVLKRNIHNFSLPTDWVGRADYQTLKSVWEELKDLRERLENANV